MITRLRSHSTGFTLVELLLALMIGVIVLGLGGALLITGLKSQKTVDSGASVTRAATTIDQSLTTGIRNAIAVSLTSVGSSDQLLRAKSLYVSSSGTQTWRCLAWYYRTSTKQLYFTTSTSAMIATPTTAGLASWQVLAEQLSVTADSSAVFTLAGSNQVNLSYTVTDGQIQQSAYSTSIIPEPVPSPTPGPGATLTCT